MPACSAAVRDFPYFWHQLKKFQYGRNTGSEDNTRLQHLPRARDTEPAGGTCGLLESKGAEAPMQMFRILCHLLEREDTRAAHIRAQQV